MNNSPQSAPTVDDDVTGCPVGPVQLPPRNRVGVRASVLAGVPVTGTAASGLLSFPTVISFDAG